MRVQILGLPRGGTSYLYDVVRQFYSPMQHADYGNEPFHPELHVDPTTEDPIETYKKKILSISQLEKCVIKNHLLHLVPLQQHNILEDLKQTIDYNILIVRRNIFDIVMSIIVSWKTGEWFSYKPGDSIIISADEFEKTWHGIYYNTLALYTNEFKINYNEVVYYEDFSRSMKTDWANLKLCNTDIAKLNDLNSAYTKAPSKKSFVTNYAELKELSIKIANREEYSVLRPLDNILPTYESFISTI